MSELKFSQDELHYINKMMDDFPFLKRSEGIYLMQVARAETKRDECQKELAPLVSVKVLNPIANLFRSVKNGCENDLYDAFIVCVKTGEVRQFPDSRLMQKLLDKAVRFFNDNK